MSDIANAGVVRRCRPWLGTFVEICVPTGGEAVVDEAYRLIAHVHHRMSFHEETSDLAALRRAPAGEAVEIDADTVAVLRVATALNRRSGGVFDVAIGVRLAATGFLPRPPGTDLRHMTGTTADIEILDDRHVVCRRPMLIDLGGIAKGYAVDLATESLMRAGLSRTLVNAGGDLRVIGTNTIYLRGADGMIDGATELTDSALATSSNSHLRRHHRGRPHSPHLGEGRQPLLSNEAVTVMAGRCVIADAMTKIAMTSRPLAIEMLHELGGALVRPGTARLAA